MPLPRSSWSAWFKADVRATLHGLGSPPHTVSGASGESGTTSIGLVSRGRAMEERDRAGGEAVPLLGPFAEPKPLANAWKYLVTLAALSVSFQGFVLSSFFFGYMLTHIAGGALADLHGGKKVLAAGVATWSLFTVLTPMAAARGQAMLVCRLMLGIGEGVAFPSIHSLIASNVPVEVQSTADSIVTAASLPMSFAAEK
eukprot:gene5358-5575_t